MNKYLKLIYFAIKAIQEQRYCDKGKLYIDGIEEKEYNKPHTSNFIRFKDDNNM